MTLVEFILCALAASCGILGAFLMGCIVALRRRVQVLEEFVEDLDNSLYR